MYGSSIEAMLLAGTLQFVELQVPAPSSKWAVPSPKRVRILSTVEPS